MKITKIIKKSEASRGQTRVAFEVDGDKKVISCFTAYPEAYEVGLELKGQIVPKEKDGKTYHNYYEPKASQVARPQSQTDNKYDHIIALCMTANGKLDAIGKYLIDNDPERKAAQKIPF